MFLTVEHAGTPPSNVRKSLRWRLTELAVHPRLLTRNLLQ